MPDQTYQEELEQLLTKLEDSELDALDRIRLGEILGCDPNMLDHYLDQIEMEAMLRETYGLLNRSFIVSPNSPIISPGVNVRPRTKRSVSTGARLVLASVSFAIVGYFIGVAVSPSQDESALISAPAGDAAIADQSEPSKPVLTPGTPETLNVCRISHRTQAQLHQLKGDSYQDVSGDELAAGQYRLSQGNLGLLYESGARIILQSPASFRLLSSKHLILDEGRTNVLCSTKQSKGFLVETPSGLATDLGTEFAVEVNTTNGLKDEFHVFTGEVSLRPKLSPYNFKLTEGHATRLDHKTSTPAGIDLDHQRFIRSFETHSDEYYHKILSHKPAVYYTMSDVGDGNTLYNETQDLYHGMIFKPDQQSNHWGPGFNGGTSFQMDGMNCEIYAVVPDYPKAQSDELTVMAWIYAESRPCWGSIAKNWGHKSEARFRGQFHFGLYAFTGQLEASVNDKTDQEVFAIDSEPLPLHQWHHVALVVDASSLKLYRNGAMVAHSQCHGLNGNPEIRPLAIGTKLGNETIKPAVTHNSFWDGRVDHLAIINKSLSADEISELYHIGVTSSEEFLGNNRIVKLQE